jgi:acetolactate synthase-1/2/3 large subunit
MGVQALPVAAELSVGLTVLIFDDRGFGWPRFMRRRVGADVALVSFHASIPPEAIVTSLGGWAARPPPSRVHEALADAEAVARSNRIAAVVVDVGSSEIPVGIRRVFGYPAGERLDHDLPE